MFDTITSISLKNTFNKHENVIRRVEFDPSNVEHVASAHSFFTKGKWGSPQFMCEDPFHDVPTTVINKLCEYTLHKLMNAK